METLCNPRLLPLAAQAKGIDVRKTKCRRANKYMAPEVEKRSELIRGEATCLSR
jgi:hypothetical protein